MQDFEKLGSFYLGREYDHEADSTTKNMLLYDSRDLCTHAVVVGMTGSGKTGLCVGMLEEAAIDRIPAIVIDPKGDISNLLLTFPNLSPEEFRPWIDEGQAAREGVSPEVFATQEADKWKSGLAKWGQDGERIRKLRDTVDMRVYTPGSNSGRPLTILKSFCCPNDQVLNSTDALSERVSAATSGLLALLGIEADPIRSREHILISRILDSAWRDKRDLDLGKIIGAIQDPPFQRVGIMELDAFYPKKERMELAMTLNNLLASPSFASWLQGEPLDIKRMLHTPEGKPCISIVSIAHLSDSERMFFVTILLNEMITWMRSQPGTSSLRALLYMDEVFGYFPPVKNPPSKQPMLTLLKQARAFGLGCVLATQNPVDLDYKGLSNAGTWFLGRLQTERDKARVLEGLEGAAADSGVAFNREAIEPILAGLNSRVFMMNNVHDDGPVLFETRWAMSYLRGPLTRQQLQKLMDDDPNFNPDDDNNLNTPRRPASENVAPSASQVDQRQLIPSDVRQTFATVGSRIGSGDRLVYRPALLGRGRLHFVKSTFDVDQWEQRSFLSELSGGELPDEVWEQAQALVERMEVDSEPESPAEFAEACSDFQKVKNYKTWEKEFKEFLYRKQNLPIWKCVDLKEYSQPEETLGDFKVRLEQLVSEKRDDAKEKLRKKFATKFSSLQTKIRRAEDKVEVEEAQYKQSRMNSVLSVGTTIMGALLGRKTFGATNARRAGASMRTFGRSNKEKDDIERAVENVEELQIKFEDLERDFNDQVDELSDKLSIENLEFDELGSDTPQKRYIRRGTVRLLASVVGRFVRHRRTRLVNLATSDKRKGFAKCRLYRSEIKKIKLR